MLPSLARALPQRPFPTLSSHCPRRTRGFYDGIKLAPTIGESLAQTVLGLEPRVPIEMYSMTRFDEGKVLQGAYGVGSIA